MDIDKIDVTKRYYDTDVPGNAVETGRVRSHKTKKFRVVPQSNQLYLVERLILQHKEMKARARFGSPEKFYVKTIDFWLPFLPKDYTIDPDDFLKIEYNGIDVVYDSFLVSILFHNMEDAETAIRLELELEKEREEFLAQSIKFLDFDEDIC